MCGGVSVYAGLKRSKLQVGDWVVISGAGGGLGHFAIQYARVMGARVLAIDIKSKETFCRDLGAEDFVDFREFSTDEALRERIYGATSGGASVALVCSSSSKVYAQASSWLRFRGTIVALGVPEIGAPKAVDVETFIVNELNFVGELCKPFQKPLEDCK
jgi:propanol-preferring alcohol dehydrogenase